MVQKAIADILTFETHRAAQLIADGIDEVEATGGDMRAFASAVLISAMKLYTAVEGPEVARLAAERIATKNEIGLMGGGSC